MPPMLARTAPIVMLLCSNVFMTTAWYWHLKFEDRPLWLVIAVSWGIALFEYCLAVPANRWGSAVYSAAELKAIQEVVTLVVFAVFSAVYLGQKLSPMQGAGFALIAAGAWCVFNGAAKV
ncbi:DMT family protein [Phenylobacterium montanum]|uniref:DMT family protein n=1 Tax=Phenylobacterium montanum TaxID=2823693 RepID=A0A975FY71_9CAUL|nr:DMT family protein [Caulobacter sp. S6]QUD87023.1 DMT family protein [Caulobacter sp. S6]